MSSNIKPILDSLLNTYQSKSADQLYNIQNQLQNSISDAKSYQPGSTYGRIDLNFLKSLRSDEKDLLSNYIFVNNNQYWSLRFLFRKSLDKGEFLLQNLLPSNLEKIINSKVFLKSLIEGIVNNQIKSQKGGNIEGNILNEIHAINIEAYKLLPVIQDVIKTPIPEKGKDLVYESIMQDLIEIIEINKGLLDINKQKVVVTRILSNLSGFLSLLNVKINTLINQKIQSGGAILNRLAHLTPVKLNKIQKQVGSGKFKRVLNRCGKKHPESVKKIRNKLKI